MSTKKVSLVTGKKYYLEVSSCPIGIWEDRFEKGNEMLRRYTEKDERGDVVDDKGKKVKYNKETDFEAWNTLYANFVEIIGMDQDYESYLRTIMELNAVLYKYINSKKKIGGIFVGDRFLRNRIKFLTAEKLNFEKTGTTVKTTINQQLQGLAKAQGYRLDRNITTVLEYFDLIKQYSKKNG